MIIYYLIIPTESMGLIENELLNLSDCLGVAFYVNGQLENLTKWPGSSQRLDLKVPNLVCYEAGTMGLHSWGFECPEPYRLGPAMAV